MSRTARGARAVAAASLALLVSCGGDESGYCAGSFVGGRAEAAMVCPGGCSAEWAEEAIDDSSGSSVGLDFPAGGGEITVRATAPGDDTFPSGANPGALMKFPVVNLKNSGVTFTLYNDGAVVSSASGGAMVTNGAVRGAGEKTWYGGASTPLDFDAVEAQVTISGNAEPLTVSVYEICGDN